MHATPQSDGDIEWELTESAMKCDVGRISAAFANGADPAKHGRDALHAAACCGELGALKRLIDGGVDPYAPHVGHAQGLLAHPAFYGHTETLQYLLDVAPKLDLQEALRASATRNHPECATLLLNAGADPRAEKSDALKWAIINDSRAVVRLLIAAGADVDQGVAGAKEFAVSRARGNTRREIAATSAWTHSLALELRNAPELTFA